MRERASCSSSPGLRLQAGRALAAAGCLLCLVSALLLPWSRAQAVWKEMPLLGDLELGSVNARLTDNTALAVIAALFSVVGLAGLALRERAWISALLVSALLILVFAAYVMSVSAEAYETLGFYRRLLDSLRDVPYLGAVAGWIEETVRKNVVFSVRPLAGFYLFPASCLLVAAGGVVMRSRSVKRTEGGLPQASNPL